MNYQSLITALARPPAALGILPEFAALRPQLQIHLYEELPSTNQTAWQLIDQGHGAGTVVITRRQSAGKGQWGRTWVSAAGGLYLSLVLEPQISLDRHNLLTLASAWGVATSLQNLGLPIQIKWPNDLMSQGRKVGGILAESRITAAIAPPHMHQAVVGLGMNWDNSIPPTAMSVRQLLPAVPTGQVHTLEDLAAIALRGLLQGYYYWQQVGDQVFVHAYQRRMAHRGKNVHVDGHSTIVEGVSLTGDLVVRAAGEGQEFARSLKPGEISLGYNV